MYCLESSKLFYFDDFKNQMNKITDKISNRRDKPLLRVI